MLELEDDIERIVRYRDIVRLDQPVRLLVFTEKDCAGCRRTRLLARELEATFPLVQVEVLDADEDARLLALYEIERLPAIALLTSGVVIRDTGIRFYGTPAGAEIDALLNDIVAVSFDEPALERATSDWLATLRHAMHLQVFVSPTARAGAAAVALAHRLALASPFIQADAINVLAFPGAARRQGVTSLPCIVVNDTIVLRGAPLEPYLLRALQEIASEPLATDGERVVPMVEALGEPAGNSPFTSSSPAPARAASPAAAPSGSASRPEPGHMSPRARRSQRQAAR